MKKCRVCGGKLSSKQLEAIKLKQSQRAKESYVRKNGLNWGRPRRIDVELCRKLRNNGLSIREIQQQTGWSIGGIHRAVTQ